MFGKKKEVPKPKPKPKPKKKTYKVIIGLRNHHRSFLESGKNMSLKSAKRLLVEINTTKKTWVGLYNGFVRKEDIMYAYWTEYIDYE